MTAAELQARLVAQGLTPSSWSNAPGDTYAAHRHNYDKVLVSADGSITFHLMSPAADGQHDVTLSPGERLDLPAGWVHAATVGPYGVTCLEAHLRAGTLAGAARRRAAAEW